MGFSMLKNPLFAPEVIQHKYLATSGSSNTLSLDNNVTPGSVLVLCLIGTSAVAGSYPGWRILHRPINPGGTPQFAGAYLVKNATELDGTVDVSVGFSAGGPNGYALLAEVRGLSRTDTLGSASSVSDSSVTSLTDYLEGGDWYYPAGEVTFFMGVSFTGSGSGAPTWSATQTVGGVEVDTGDLTQSYTALIIAIPFFLSLGFLVTNMGERKPVAPLVKLTLSISDSGAINMSSCTARGF